MNLRRFVSSILLACGTASCATAKTKSNDLVGFLAGDWDNVSFEITDAKPVKRDAYAESMVVKDFDTLTITARGFRDGKDLTKDMRLEVRDYHVTLSQGSFVAKGIREGNVYSVRGTEDGIEYRFRLYALGDKYVFHREQWKNGAIIQMDMSYLVRK